MRRFIGVLSAVALVWSMVAVTTVAAADQGSQFKVLVFTRSVAGKHASTNAGVSAIKALGKQHRFTVVETSEAGKFTAPHLKQYRAVVFLNTTGDVLDDAQQAAFEAYYTAGGGFVGIHAAIEAEPGWSFMTDLLGARATGSSALDDALITVADRVHEASASLPIRWSWADQYYDFDRSVRGLSHVLATVDETSYDGGAMGLDHPVAWCKDFRGGRSFYSALGDAATGFGAGTHRSLLGGAIRWAAGVADPVTSDCGATVLANYQQTKISAPPNLLEPIGFDVLPDDRVIQTTRSGQVRLHDPETGTTSVIATIPVYTHSEDGLYGPAIDNDFATNQWVYLYYAPATMEAPYPATTPAGAAPTTAASPSAWDVWQGYFQLSRFKFIDGATPSLDLASEQKILKVPNNRGACCHVAGDIDFDTDGNLWLVTGDDTPAGGGNSGGFSPFNDQLTNENQTIAVANATGGTFTLTFDGQTTAPIAFPLDNVAIEAALEALSNLDDVAVTGTGTRTVNFRGSLSETDVPQMTADASGLTSATTATVTIATTLSGAWYNTPHVDARRTSLNTNDLRGKILRIKVATDGTYTTPAGNLFTGAEEGGGKARPEIYAMGFRNPFRIQVDSAGVAYVTDYSPDSQTPTIFRGPAGTGRVEIVRAPSNYGWPLCYSPDLPYYRWNFNATTPLDSPPQQFDCDDPTRGPANTSRWNTGLTYSPRITAPDVWYSYQDNNATTPLGTPCLAYYDGSGGTCPQLFPELGTGGVGPHGADVYEFDPDEPNPTKFPPYYDGAVFLGEFTRDYLREVRLDDAGAVVKINNVLNCGAVGGNPTPGRPFECDNPMDLQFGEDGTFYLLTYGDGFFAANADAGMYRFEYVKGLRDPIPVLTASRTSGQEPLSVAFSSTGSRDPDPADSIRFAWDFQNDGVVDSIDPDPSFTYMTTGQFTAVLTVTDSSGRSASSSTVITVGNTAPTVQVTVPTEHGTFAFGDTIPFSVTVTDPEDGTIDCSRVQVTFVLGHDEHGHAGAAATGCSGVLVTDADDASHGGNVFGVIDATYTDLGDGSVPALTTQDQVQVRQQRQEVEFAVSQQGTNTATTLDVGGGLQRGSLGNGDWIRLNGPFDLEGVSDITFRTSGGSGAAGTGLVEIHLDAVDGPLLTSVTILPTANATTYASQTFPLVDPDGAHQLFLVFRPVTGGPGNNFFNLNWVEFGGIGIAVP